MTLCQFCNKPFKARPQVKSPRACSKCQKLRQKMNEKEWRNNNPGKYDQQYHKKQRKIRHKALNTLCLKVIEYINIGSVYLKGKIDTGRLKPVITLFFRRLGIRNVKKFWQPDNHCRLKLIKD